MIPHTSTKLRYLDEVHKTCDSQVLFFLFRSLDFLYVVLFLGRLLCKFFFLGSKMAPFASCGRDFVSELPSTSVVRYVVVLT